MVKNIYKTLKPKVLSGVQAQLGEGAVWCPLTHHLLWVDIVGCKLFRYQPMSEETKVIETHQPIGTVVPHTESTVVAALLKGLCVIDVHSKKVVEYLGNPEAQNIFTRFNGNLSVTPLPFTYTQMERCAL